MHFCDFVSLDSMIIYLELHEFKSMFLRVVLVRIWWWADFCIDRERSSRFVAWHL